ncbi:hypothetical protein ACGF8B_41855 [Streptomyces sp. NPDC047917]|uniref:hypothetical protein n=1 Tax=Streptomyces sp. NPDC047917 TaxID=3365491 RepID=UPI0037242BA7
MGRATGGVHDSAGRTRSAKVRSGNPYLKDGLGLAAFGVVRTKDANFQARYERLIARRGPLKALVAVEHSIITAIRHMLTDNVPCHELGGTYFTQSDPERASRRMVNALNQLGYTVTLNPPEGAARTTSPAPASRRPARPPGTQPCPKPP